MQALVKVHHDLGNLILENLPKDSDLYQSIGECIEDEKDEIALFGVFKEMVGFNRPIICRKEFIDFLKDNEFGFFGAKNSYNKNYMNIASYKENSTMQFSTSWNFFGSDFLPALPVNINDQVSIRGVASTSIIGKILRLYMSKNCSFFDKDGKETSRTYFKPNDLMMKYFGKFFIDYRLSKGLTEDSKIPIPYILSLISYMRDSELSKKYEKDLQTSHIKTVFDNEMKFLKETFV